MGPLIALPGLALLAGALALGGLVVFATIEAVGDDDEVGGDQVLEVPPDTLVRLVPPPMRPIEPAAEYRTRPASAEGRIALAYQFNALVFNRPAAKRRTRGIVRRNTQLAVSHWVPGDGCRGSWYRLEEGGYVCSTEGFAVANEVSPLSESLRTRRPAVERLLPYDYAKVTPGAAVYNRLPTLEELETGVERPIKAHAEGARFVSIERYVSHEGRTFIRSARGDYFDFEDLQLLGPTDMHGELLDEETSLPLGFVHEAWTPVHDPGDLGVVGFAVKYARFEVADVVGGEGASMVLTDEGVAVPSPAVRVAREIERPERVPETDRWIHIDLRQQTLVAYEGDEPVLATLIAGGKRGFEPPLGLFRIHKKYVSKTMAGPDDVAGTYEVDQVPWTMYYWGSFALHGAYWHDGFGKVRSHGCTNIPPADARWLFYWSQPELPDGWHGAVGLRGPWVYFTNHDVASQG